MRRVKLWCSEVVQCWILAIPLFNCRILFGGGLPHPLSASKTCWLCTCGFYFVCSTAGMLLKSSSTSALVINQPQTTPDNKHHTWMFAKVG